MVFKNRQQPRQGGKVAIYITHGVDFHEFSVNTQLEAGGIQIRDEQLFALYNKPQIYIPDADIRTLVETQ